MTCVEDCPESRVSALIYTHRNHIDPLDAQNCITSHDECKKNTSVVAAVPNSGYRKHFFNLLAVIVVAIVIVSTLTTHAPRRWITHMRRNAATSSVLYSFDHSCDNSSAMCFSSSSIRLWTDKQNTNNSLFVKIMRNVANLRPRLTLMCGAECFIWDFEEPMCLFKWLFLDIRLIAHCVGRIADVLYRCSHLFLIYVQNAFLEGHRTVLNNEPNSALPEWTGAIQKYLFPEKYAAIERAAEGKNSAIQMESRTSSLVGKNNFGKKYVSGSSWAATEHSRPHGQREISIHNDKSEEVGEEERREEKEKEKEKGEVLFFLWRWLFDAEVSRTPSKKKDSETSVLITSGSYARSSVVDFKERTEGVYWLTLFRDFVERVLSSIMISGFVNESGGEENVLKSSNVSSGKSFEKLVTARNTLQKTETDSLSVETKPVPTHYSLRHHEKMTENDNNNSEATNNNNANHIFGVIKSNRRSNAFANHRMEPLNVSFLNTVAPKENNFSFERHVPVGNVHSSCAGSAMHFINEKCQSDAFLTKMTVRSRDKTKEKSPVTAANEKEKKEEEKRKVFIAPLPTVTECAARYETAIFDCKKNIDKREQKCQRRIARAVNIETQPLQNEFKASMLEEIRKVQSECLSASNRAVREERARALKSREAENPRKLNVRMATRSQKAHARKQSPRPLSFLFFENERKHFFPQCAVSSAEAVDVHAKEKEDEKTITNLCRFAIARAVQESARARHTHNHNHNNNNNNNERMAKDKAQMEEKCRQSTALAVRRTKTEAKKRCEAHILSVVSETVESQEKKCDRNIANAVAREVQMMQREQAIFETKITEREKRLCDVQCKQRIRESVHWHKKRTRPEPNNSLAETQSEKEKAETQSPRALCRNFTAAKSAAESVRFHAPRKENASIVTFALTAHKTKAADISSAQLFDAREISSAACHLQTRGEENSGYVFMHGILFAVTALCVCFGFCALFARKPTRRIVAFCKEIYTKSFKKTICALQRIVKSAFADFYFAAAPFLSRAARGVIFFCGFLLRCARTAAAAFVFFIFRFFSDCLRRRARAAEFRHSFALFLSFLERSRTEILCAESDSRAALQQKIIATLSAEIIRLAAREEKLSVEKLSVEKLSVEKLSGEKLRGEKLSVEKLSVEKFRETWEENVAEMMRDCLLAENRRRHEVQLELKLLRWRNASARFRGSSHTSRSFGLECAEEKEESERKFAPEEYLRWKDRVDLRSGKDSTEGCGSDASSAL